MVKLPQQDPLRSLEARLSALKEEGADKPTKPGIAKPMTGYSLAFAIATDLVSGVLGGAFLGWLFDRWLETAPWGMVGFFIVGSIAGMWNAYRTARGYDAGMGFRPLPTGPDAGPDERDRAPRERRQERGGE